MYIFCSTKPAEFQIYFAVQKQLNFMYIFCSTKPAEFLYIFCSTKPAECPSWIYRTRKYGSGNGSESYTEGNQRSCFNLRKHLQYVFHSVECFDLTSPTLLYFLQPQTFYILELDLTCLHFRARTHLFTFQSSNSLVYILEL